MSGLAKASGIPTIDSVLAIAEIASPTHYLDIANIGDITGSSSRSVNDVSSHGVKSRRKVSGILDEGTYSFPLFFIPQSGTVPTHTDPTNGLYNVYKRNDLRAYALFVRDQSPTAGAARYFNAYITKFSEVLSVAGVYTATVELTIDGEVLTGTETGGKAAAVFAPAES